MTSWRRLAGLGLLLALSATAGWSQGFMVRPLVMDLEAKPNQALLVPLELTASSPGQRQVIEILPVYLDQGANGAWVPIPKDAPEAVDYQGRSCLDWIEFPGPAIELPPLAKHEATLKITIPRDARGTYAAGMLVRRQPTGDAKIKVAVQFLVPILLTVQGAPARQRIGAEDLTMEHLPVKREIPANTRLAMRIANSGEVYTTVSGRITVLRDAGEGYFPLVQRDLKRTAILPGATIDIQSDLGRTFPSGNYRLQGVLRVSGRPKGSLTREIVFEGDPTVTSVAPDVAVAVDPPSLEARAVPGSQRTTLIKIQNPSPAPLQVVTSVATPPGLTGVAMGEVRGTDYSAAPWIEVQPQTFLLPAGQQRNIKLVVKYPKDLPDDKQKPNYFADLLVESRYTDGRSAGQVEARIRLDDPRRSAETKAAGMGLTIAQVEGAQYAVTARYGNTGSTPWRPVARAVVADPLGVPLASIGLESEATEVLPLGVPEFSGVLDFSEVEPGLYFVQSQMSYGADELALQQLAVEVKAVDGKKEVAVIKEPVGPPAPPPEPPGTD